MNIKNGGDSPLQAWDVVAGHGGLGGNDVASKF